MTLTHTPGVMIAQKGSRQHFLVARVLEERGALTHLVVDAWTPAWLRHGLPAGMLQHSPGRRLLGAWHPDIPDHKVRSLLLYGMARRLAERCVAPHQRRAIYARTDAAFARRVARLHLAPHDVFFGFAYASLEILKAERNRGVTTILDQIDPGLAEHEIVTREAQAWPRYADVPDAVAQASFDRNREEWALADAIVVNSDWTKSLLVRQGVAAEKIHTIPLAYQLPDRPPPPRTPPSTLRVLWLGSVCVRKGIQYLVEAARMLREEPVEFVIVGPQHIKPEAIAAAPANMQWLGGVPRAEAAAHYRAADLFVLPTLSDGFALTQLEAMAHGLPVIATPNCGSVTLDNRTGSIVPAGDADALAESIRTYTRDLGRAAGMHGACLQRAAEFSLQAFGRRLMEIVTTVVQDTGRKP